SPHRGQRHGGRDPGARGETALRPLLPGLDRDDGRRHRPRAPDREDDRRGARRHGLRREPRGSGNDVHGRPAPARRRSGGGGPVTDGAVERERPVVLAADDDEDILALIAFRLERSGYTVILARDGAEALELARGERPDLGVFDVMMPKLDGFELTRRLRTE